jgi:mRNA interferase MazF
MGKFVKGEVVVVPFPFSDLSSTKRRPALVITSLTGDDVILCQITSKSVSDNYTIPLLMSDFVSGTITQDSNIRPNRLFTADGNIILYQAGRIKPEKLNEVVNKIIAIIS